MALRSEDLASKDELTVYKCEVEDEEENDLKVVDKLTEEKCSLAQRFYDLFVRISSDPFSFRIPLQGKPRLALESVLESF
jgi:hypothetical protein